MTELERLIRKMPKLEMHIHIEGTFDKETVCGLAKSQGIQLPRPESSLFAFSDLAEFLDMLDWICSLVKDRQTARQIAYRFAEYAREQNIIYAEVIVNPSHWKHIAIGELSEGILEGFDEAYKDNLADCRLLISLRREQDTQSASDTVDWLLQHRHPRIIGLSIDGNEELAENSNERFAPLFAKCRNAGLKAAVHAGESSGPEGVIGALDMLKADRIDHGVRAIDDPDLLRRLKEGRVPLDVCFTSNVLSGVYTEDSHPLGRLYDAGINVNASTDDPHLFQITLCSELERIAERYSWDISTLLQLQYNALEAAFCNDADKASIRSRLDAFRQSIS